MNEKHTLKALKLANIAVWGLIAGCIILAVLWFYPRETVIVNDFYTTEEVYQVGDELTVTTRSSTHFNGVSYYDQRLDCDQGRYLLRSFTLTTAPREEKKTKTTAGLVPVIPTPDNCKMITFATHEVQILPFLHRNYTNQWETNRFFVEARGVRGN